MGVGQAVEGPQLTPPRLSLVNSAQLVEETDERWTSGIRFEPESCGGDVGVVRYCDPPELKGDGSRPDEVEYEPFGIFGADTCSTMGRADIAEYRARARRKLEAFGPKQLEYEFWTGTLIPGNPHLAGDGAIEVTPGGGPADPVDALAILELELGNCSSGGRGMIHASRRLVTLWADRNLVRRDAALLLTILDTVVVPGTGYPGTAPDGSLPAGSEFAYATGMVQVRRGPVDDLPKNLSEATDRARNEITVRAERMSAVLFDPCCHLAIEVESPTAVGS